MPKVSEKTARRIDRILECSSDNFAELVRYSGLHPMEDFRFKVLRNVDFGGSDIRFFDFTGSTFENCRFRGARVREASFAGSHFIGEDFRLARTATADDPAEEALIFDSVRSAPARHRTAPSIEEVIRDLEGQAASPDWHISFRLAWYDFNGDPRLLELGEWWLRTHGWSAKGPALVMIPILASPGRNTGPTDRVRELAHQWLDSAPVRDSSWVTLWRLVLAKADERAFLLELGAAWLERLLGPLLGDGPPSVRLERAWVELWQALSLEGRFETLLLHTAEQASAKLRSVRFVTKILVPLLGRQRRHQFVEASIFDWLARSDPERRAWPEVYEAFLEDLRDRQKAIRLGLDRLAHLPNDAATWPSIWLALVRYTETRRVLQLAEAWLSRSDLRSSAWPNILIEVLKRGKLGHASPLIARAQKWLTLGKRHPHRRAIEDFVEEDGAYRASVEDGVGTSFPLMRSHLMRCLSENLGIELWKERSTRFWGHEGKVRAVCLLSKRHDAKGDNGRYWFGYYDSAHRFLMAGDDSYLILAPTDRANYYAIPLQELRAFLGGVPKTVRRQNFYWHLELIQRGHRSFLKKSGTKPGLEVTSFARNCKPRTS